MKKYVFYLNIALATFSVSEVSAIQPRVSPEEIQHQITKRTREAMVQLYVTHYQIMGDLEKNYINDELAVNKLETITKDLIPLLEKISEETISVVCQADSNACEPMKAFMNMMKPAFQKMVIDGMKENFITKSTAYNILKEQGKVE